MAKYKRVTTPTGVAHYPWLKDPDTKFVKEGLYSCNIFLDMDDAKGLMKTIDKAIEDKVDFEKKETGKSKLKTCTPPYIVGGSEDDTNDIVPKGQVLFKIKSKAEINGTPVRPLVYDSKSSEPYSGGLKVFGGSKVKVAFDHPNIEVVTDNAIMLSALKRFKWENKNLVMMTSWNFGGLDLK